MSKLDYFHSVRIIEDRCNGCTHCIRTCATEAIRVRNGKATIRDIRCIDCGECIRICPRQAVSVACDPLSSIKKFKYTIALPSTVFATQLPDQHNLNKLFNGLLRLGFDEVFEEAHANPIISYAVNRFLKEKAEFRPYISSVCPAIVRLVQVRFPSLVEHILPIESPVDIAARIIRNKKVKELNLRSNQIGIFYITPCPARSTATKQPEGTRFSNVDGTIAMNEIISKLLLIMDNIKKQEKIVKAPQSALRWAASGEEMNKSDTFNALSVDGIKNVVQILNKIENNELGNFDFIEAYACPCGCVGGVLNIENAYVAKHRVFIKSKKKEIIKSKDISIIAKKLYEKGEIFLEQRVEPRPVLKLDRDMRKAIQKLEKLERILDNLPGIDCGACGSPTCRALAEDIVQDKAKITDCLFIRR